MNKTGKTAPQQEFHGNVAASALMDRWRERDHHLFNDLGEDGAACGVRPIQGFILMDCAFRDNGQIPAR